ncbi:MAG: chemotaxis protein CheA [Piscirickettsiaceae bacterium]|nr:chemotaxis protein CheA [Piscirickettsiaceae bacterium]
MGVRLEYIRDTQTVTDEGDSRKGWEIDFRPHAHLLQMGTDPVRLLRELESLGELTVIVDDSKLPSFADLEPEDSYLSWQLTIVGDITKEDVIEIFEWVKDDCYLSIKPIVDVVDISVEPVEPLVDSVDEIVAALETKSESAKSSAESISKAAASPATASIRVGTDKMDSLSNLVGELVITQSMLRQIGDNFTEDMLPQLIDGLAKLESNSREMQKAIMSIRMLPISFAFNRFPRLVEDMTDKMGKKVDLKLSGDQIELDQTVMEKIGDLLVHLVRNSLDHSLETPDVRLAAGKDEVGILELKAFHEGGNIVIQISDDGAGLNEQKIFDKAVENGLIQASDEISPQKIHELIFLPGFSTADVVTDVSGFGVDMGDVRKNIISLGGSVEMVSKQGEGSTFTIRLPLTLGIMDGQTISVAGEHYIIPLISIIESLEVSNTAIKRVPGKGELYLLRNEYIPIIRIYDVFNLEPHITDLEEGLLVVVDADDQKVGLFIDDLLGQQQVTIKSLETNFRKVLGVSGATILVDGTVALILDIPGLITLFKEPSLAKVVISDEQAA